MQVSSIALSFGTHTLGADMQSDDFYYLLAFYLYLVDYPSLFLLMSMYKVTLFSSHIKKQRPTLGYLSLNRYFFFVWYITIFDRI